MKRRSFFGSFLAALCVPFIRETPAAPVAPAPKPDMGVEKDSQGEPIAYSWENGEIVERGILHNEHGQIVGHWVAREVEHHA